MPGFEEPKSPWAPPVARLTRSVAPVWRSCTKISAALFVSPATRLVAEERKATYRPSALMLGSEEWRGSTGCAVEDDLHPGDERLRKAVGEDDLDLVSGGLDADDLRFLAGAERRGGGEGEPPRALHLGLAKSGKGTETPGPGGGATSVRVGADRPKAYPARPAPAAPTLTSVQNHHFS